MIHPGTQGPRDLGREEMTEDGTREGGTEALAPAQAFGRGHRALDREASSACGRGRSNQFN